jgi:FkbM family methyltransferase
MADLTQLDDLFARLIASPPEHARTSAAYQALAAQWSAAFRTSAFANAAPTAVPFGPFGALTLPYRSMGAIDSVDLFGLDELILFAFYWANRARYRRTVDIGANIGLHSIVMTRCGFAVRAFEPDPVHVEILRGNLALNGISGVDVVEAAVSDRDGATEFVRVKGNTTGSHLAGAKGAPYGALDRFSVTVRNAFDAVADADFAKIDAEGHEAVILRSLPAQRWQTLDAVVEVGTPENARALFDHFAALPVGLFAQKIGWERVRESGDMPTSHREGSVFVSAKSDMPWQGLAP